MKCAMGSDRTGDAVTVRRLPRPDDRRRAESLHPRLKTVSDRVRKARSGRIAAMSWWLWSYWRPFDGGWDPSAKSPVLPLSSIRWVLPHF